LKILLTGATGFIGERLLKSLSSAQDNELYCTTRAAKKPGDRERITWIHQDFSKKLDFSLFPVRLDTIIHLAQSKNYRNFPEQAIDIFDINVSSTVQLLDYGRQAGISSFVFASTGGVYGYKDSPILETDTPNPSGFYPYSKYISECLVKSYSTYFSTVILRYFFVYGEGQRDMLMPNLIASIMAGRPIIIHNGRGRRINPVYVDDAVKATIASPAVQGSEIINVAGEETISILELSELIGQLINKKPKLDFVTENQEIDMVADISKMKLKLSVNPKIFVNEGLSRVVTSILEKE